jgi:hypothetical protein
MFSLILTQKSDERFVEISMSGFRLILALDYLLYLQNIFTKALITNTESQTLEAKSETTPMASIKKQDNFCDEQTKIELKEKKKCAPKTSQVMNVMRFNLTQVDIVLLESIEVTNTTAIIMSCQSSIDMKQKTNFLQLSGQVSEISMILTNYERYISKQEIDAYIMKPTDLSINGTTTGI